ncbi:MAG TPA: tetratricopeptide repeat protein [Pyrinomonadaceae bacterium]|nr:tetratricopeptide repeat protein [Pyrinomonadaceae bacterium]
MFRATIPLIAILFIATASNGQPPQTAQGYLKSSMAHYQGGAIDAALTDVNKAIALDANSLDALFLRAAIRSQKGDMAGVLADYNKIIEIAPSVPGVEVIFTNRAVIRLQNADVNGALEDLKKALSLNPRVAEIHNTRAIVHLQKGDLDGALADYEKALELKPTLAPALVGRGYFRYQKKDFDGALADFSKVIELAPNNHDAYVSRGIVRGLKGEIDGALADLRKGAALNPKSVSDSARGNFSSPYLELNQFLMKYPTNARAYEIRGIFKLLQRKETEAAQDFSKSMELEPALKSEIDRIIKELGQANKSKSSRTANETNRVQSS